MDTGMNWSVGTRSSSNGGAMEGSAFGPFGPFGSGGAGATQTPLSDTVRAVQAEATKALALVAKEHPHVQRLVSGYGAWESQLRSEAQRRLAGPPGLLATQGPWPMLTAAPAASMSGRERAHAHAPPPLPEHAGGPGLRRRVHLQSQGMLAGAAAGHSLKGKRSASENCLVGMGHGVAPAGSGGGAGAEADAAARGTGKATTTLALGLPPGARAPAADTDPAAAPAFQPFQPWQPWQQQQQQAASGAGWGGAFNFGTFGMEATANLFSADADPLVGPSSPPSDVSFGSTFFPKQQSPAAAASAADGGDGAAAAASPPAASTPPVSPPPFRASTEQPQQQQRHFPRVVTAPSSLLHLSSALASPMSTPQLSLLDPFDPEVRHLDAEGSSETALLGIGAAIIDGSREALRNAQRSIQETAKNCEQNLNALGSLLNAQHRRSTGSDGGGFGSADGAAPWSLVPWGLPSSGAAAAAPDTAAAAAGQASAASPRGWNVLPPRDPNHRSHQQQQSAKGKQKLLLAGAAAADTEGLTLEGGGTSAGPLALAGAGTAPAAALDTDDDWVSPIDRYIKSLEQLKGGQERGGKGRAFRSLREDGRQVAIVTTASLPWMTGTSVNPLLRAAYLSSDAGRKVTLVIPWLSAPDQDQLFPAGTRFDSPEEQEAYVRDWARKRTGLDCNFRISFYPGRYAAEKGSILPVGDITQVIPDHEADVAVLEEPEHLNWFHHGTRWTDKFNHVVGIMHTNYLDYARREEHGNIKEMIIKHVNAWVVRAHCHKVIKLSDAVQKLPREETMFVHGVSPSFLKVGQRKASEMLRGADAPALAPAAAVAAAGGPGAAAGPSGDAGGAGAGPKPDPWGKGVYFIGKVLWAKGYTELLQRMSEHAQRTGQNIDVDVYGSGPDLKAVQEEAARKRLNLRFNGAKDHADQSIQDYKVFVNPSLSDVVATTTAEALAMGKFVVCADHPSNRFFSRFPNCLIYRNDAEFSQCLSTALSRQPKPLSPDELHALSWEAATERFLDTAEIKQGQHPLESAMDGALHAAHNAITGIEALRVMLGAGTQTRDAPQRVTDYVPRSDDVGGLFDNHARARGEKQPAK